MEPMDVVEALLQIAMPLGILEIAVEPWTVGKEPTSDAEAEKDSSASNDHNKGGRGEAVGKVTTM